MESSGQRQQKLPQSTPQASTQQTNALPLQSQQNVQTVQTQQPSQQAQKHHPLHHPGESVEVETAGGGGGGVFPEAGSWLCCLPCVWLRGNTSVHKASLTAAMLLVMSLLVASPVLFLISSTPGSEKSRDCLPNDDDESCGGGDPSCQTLACRGAAERVEAAITWSADPCKDFYQFACGGWGRHQALTALQDRVDSDIRHLLEEATSGPFQKLGDFYSSCLRARDMSLLSPMFTLLDELGGYLPPSSQGPPDLSTLLSRLLRVNGAPLFDAYVERDLHNGSRLVIFIDLPRRFAHTSRLHHHPLAYHELLYGQAASVNLRHRRFAEESRAYVYLKDSSEERRLLTMEGLVQRFLPATMAGEMKTKEAHNILLFASLLSKLYPRAKELANRLQQDDSYEYHNLTQLQKSYNFIQWKPFLEHIFSTNITVSDNIYVMAPSYMNSLSHLLSRFQTRGFFEPDNYENQCLIFNLVPLAKRHERYDALYLFKLIHGGVLGDIDMLGRRVPYTNIRSHRLFSRIDGVHDDSPMSRVIHNSLLLIYATDILHELVNSTMSDNNRAGFCTRVTVSVFSKAVSTLYITQYSPQYLQHLDNRVKKMFTRLKGTLAKRIEEVSWMDEKTKTAALKKLSALRGHFMTWPQLWNQTYLDSLLQDINVNPNNFFHNVIKRYRQLRTFPVDFHSQQPSDRKWAYPFVVNAFYEVTLNSIVIPLAVLTQPYFRTDVPLYVQYGTIGLIFSHEILHGFDLTGAVYGDNGERNPWMSASIRLRLEARLECVAKQYADAFHKKVSFLGTPVDVQFDWNVTRNENMADVSGLEIAFETWLHLQDKHHDPVLPGLNFKPEQLFFLHAAQVYCTDMSPEDYIVLVEKDFHTPAPERVNGIMMNSQAFAEAFSCPVGAKMNPAKKCSTY